MSDPVLVDSRGGVCVLTLNAPAKRNAISTAMRLALRDQLQALGVDRDCRAIVLTGAGGQFCAGGDVTEMTAGASDPLWAARRLTFLHDSVRAIVGGAKPVVAAVEGVAAGAGLSLMAACDVVVASREVRMIASFVRIGLVADCGLQFTLAARVGAAAAHRILLGGETVGAERAATIGLVDELVAPGEALARAVAIAESYAALPPLALAATKAMRARSPATLEDALALEADIQSRLAMTADHDEAKRAFQERRPATFEGR